MQRTERLHFISIGNVLDSTQVDIWWRSSGIRRRSNSTRCSEVCSAEQWPLISFLNFYLTVLPTSLGILPMKLALVEAVGVAAKSQNDCNFEGLIPTRFIWNLCRRLFHRGTPVFPHSSVCGSSYAGGDLAVCNRASEHVLWTSSS